QGKRETASPAYFAGWTNATRWPSGFPDGQRIRRWLIQLGDFTAGHRGGTAINEQVDVVADERHASVRFGELHATGMTAEERIVVRPMPPAGIEVRDFRVV